MKREEVLARLQALAEDIRRRFNVRELAVFGSVVRDEAREDSDLDVLVTFEGAADFDRFMDLRFFLEDTLGVGVDLVTRAGLRPELRTAVEREAIRVA